MRGAVPRSAALCVAPNAACSCFSTAAIWSCTSLYSVVESGVEVVLVAVYVEQSFSWSTIDSTSSKRRRISVVFSFSDYSWVGMLTWVWSDWERVVLKLFVSSCCRWLDSALDNLIYIFSTMSSSLQIRSCYVLFTPSWVRPAWFRRMMSLSKFLNCAVMSLFMSCWFRLTSVWASPSSLTFFSKAFPAVWTVVMEASALNFQFASSCYVAII
jgi:hypothetical protein